MIQVIGNLSDPLGQPLETSIRITAENSEVTIAGSSAIILVGAAGSYDFGLVEGRFHIELKVEGEYTQQILVLVDGNTPLVISLPELLLNHTTVPLVTLTANELDIAALNARVTALEAV